MECLINKIIDIERKKIKILFSGNIGVKVWADVIGTRIITPIFFQVFLTGERYLELIQNDNDKMLMDLPLGVSQQMYFPQEEAPLHNAARPFNEPV